MVKSKLMNWMKKNSSIINNIVLYFCIISMFLFLTTNFFKYVKFGLGFVSVYVIFYSYLIGWRNIKNTFNSLFHRWYFIFWVYLILVTFLNNYTQLEVLCKNFIVFTLYIYNIILLCEDKKSIKEFNVFKLTRIVSIIVCLWILIADYKLLFSGERIGFSIMTLNPNGAGTVLSVLFFAMIYIIRKEKRIVDILIAILVLLVTFLTGSKHAIIMSVISLIIFIFDNGRFSKKRIILFVVGICLSITIVFSVPFLRKNVGERFLKLLGTMNIIEYENDYSSSQRVKYTAKAIELWKKNPIIGGGYNNVSVNSGFNTYSHNNYIEVLCSVGLIGFIFYYGYIIFLLCRSLKYKERNNRLFDHKMISILILLAILISDVGAVTFTLYPFYYLILFFIDKKYGMHFSRN